ncbi:MBL fold metallo-hydrolase, partial [Candidatus Hydrogenedentota bacterium]
GVNNVNWVVFTHAHRDQCQGGDQLKGKGINVGVPEEQLKYFEDPGAVWDANVIYHNYSFKPDFFEPIRRIYLDKAIASGEWFQWEDIGIETMSNKGHTKEESLTYIFYVDGKRFAFTGDLIHSPGKIWNFHDLQWKYNGQEGANAAVKTLEELRAEKVDVLLPSHGVVMADPASAIDETLINLKEVMDVLLWEKGNKDKALSNTKLSPHVFHTRTSFFIIADNGNTLLYDMGVGGGFLDSIITKLKKEHGLKKIDKLLLSHYHDDHVGGVPYVKKKYGAELWVHENLVDIIENPYRYNIPCIGSKGTKGNYPDEQGPKVDRVLRENETFEWEGYKFTVFHFPGQTEYHMGMYVEMDGHRMLFMGDSTYTPAPGTIFRGENFNCRNYCRLGEGTGYLECAEILKKYNPDWAMAAHFGAIPIEPKDIEDYYQWAKKLEPAFAKLIARDNPNFGTDPNWLSFYPYRLFAEAGEAFTTEVRVRNHSSHRARAVVTPILPKGWTADPAEVSVSVKSEATGIAKFTVKISKGDPLPLRTVITANVRFDGTDFGEYPEMIVDKRSEKDSWPDRFKKKMDRNYGRKKKAPLR